MTLNIIAPSLQDLSLNCRRKKALIAQTRHGTDCVDHTLKIFTAKTYSV